MAEAFSTCEIEHPTATFAVSRSRSHISGMARPLLRS